MEKTYYDETFIGARNRQEQYLLNKEKLEQEEENNIKNGYVKIEGYTLVCEEKEVDGKIKIVLPETFSIMDPVYASFKYPGNRSATKQIYTNEETSVNFIFDFKNEDMPSEDTEEVRDMILEMMRKLHPSAKTMETSCLDAEIAKIAYFEIIIPALDGDIYNLMFVFSYDEKMAMGTFNCMAAEMDDWKDIAKQMLQSIACIEAV